MERAPDKSARPTTRPASRRHAEHDLASAGEIRGSGDPARGQDRQLVAREHLAEPGQVRACARPVAVDVGHHHSAKRVLEAAAGRTRGSRPVRSAQPLTATSRRPAPDPVETAPVVETDQNPGPASDRPSRPAARDARRPGCRRRHEQRRPRASRGRGLVADCPRRLARGTRSVDEISSTRWPVRRAAVAGGVEIDDVQAGGAGRDEGLGLLERVAVDGLGGELPRSRRTHRPPGGRWRATAPRSRPGRRLGADAGEAVQEARGRPKPTSRGGTGSRTLPRSKATASSPP